jgi:hypothetical protein
MKPVEVYCCGEVISCTDAVNVCDTCGAEYDIEGDKITNKKLWTNTNIDDLCDSADVIIVNE